TFATIGLMTKTGAFAQTALGAVLAAYGAYGLFARRFEVQRKNERWLSPLIGLVTGSLSGATGVFVIPWVPYLTSLKMNSDEMVAARQQLQVEFGIDRFRPFGALGGLAAIVLAIEHQQGHRALPYSLPGRFAAFAALSLRRLAREEGAEVLADAHAMAQFELLGGDQITVVEISLQQCPRVGQCRLALATLLAFGCRLIREARQQAARGEHDDFAD